MLKKKSHFFGEEPTPISLDNPLYKSESGLSNPLDPQNLRVNQTALPRDPEGLIPGDRAMEDVGYIMHPEQRPKPYAPGIGDYLAGLFIDGQTPEATRRDFATYAEQQRRLAQRHIMEQSITDPDEMRVYLTSPEEWAKNKATLFGKTVLNEGQTLDRPGQADKTIAKTPKPADEPSYSDITDRVIRSGQAALERAKFLGSKLDWFKAQSGRIAAQKQPLQIGLGNVTPVRPAGG